MKQPIFWLLGAVCIAGLLSGCGGSDNVPIIPPSGPTASAEEHRIPESDALTSQEAAPVSQADAEPEPPQKPDI